MPEAMLISIDMDDSKRKKIGEDTIAGALMDGFQVQAMTAIGTRSVAVLLVKPKSNSVGTGK